MSDQIITKRVRFAVEEKAVLLHFCLCGDGYPTGVPIPHDQDAPLEMDCCGRRLYWSDDRGQVDIIEADMTERA